MSVTRPQDQRALLRRGEDVEPVGWDERVILAPTAVAQRRLAPLHGSMVCTRPGCSIATWTVSVWLVKTRIMPPLAIPSRGQE